MLMRSATVIHLDNCFRQMGYGSIDCTAAAKTPDAERLLKMRIRNMYLAVNTGP